MNQADGACGDTRTDGEGIRRELEARARFARRLARGYRDDGESVRPARLFLLAREMERDAKRRGGPWWTFVEGENRLFPLPGP